ncbi:MAG: hypothetical protein C0506_05355 [Anaerolinea sp.]|nr:hypothetical protein [Anaerolinea sp.]
MSSLPILTAREVVAALAKVGITPVRQKGSHLVLHGPEGRRTVVPVHPGEDVDRHLLHRILRQCKLSEEGFLLLLK